MEQPLHGLNHNRVVAAGNIEDALHAQQIVAVTEHQGVEPIRHVLPMQRRIELQTERADVGTVAVHIFMTVMVMMVVRCGAGRIRLIGFRIEPLQHVAALGIRIVDIRHREFRW